MAARGANWPRGFILGSNGMTPTDEGGGTIGHLLIIILALAGALSLTGGFLGLVLLKSTPFAQLGWAVGASILAALIVLGLDRKVPKDIERVKVVRGHAAIYRAYEEQIATLAGDKTHKVRTLSSSPQSKEVAEYWDGFLTAFLRQNPSVIYTRYIVKDDRTPEWSRRLPEIQSRYAGLANYRQYLVTGPPSIEFFLVDDSLAFLTFASQLRAQETMGIRIHDRDICKELLNYCETQLEDRYARQSLSAKTSIQAGQETTAGAIDLIMPTEPPRD